MKICSKCHTPKKLEEFAIDSQNKSGKRNDCKKCNSIKSNQYQKLNREKRREYYKKWKEKNLEKIREYNKNYQPRSLELARTKYKNEEYRQKSNEKRRAYNKLPHALEAARKREARRRKINRKNPLLNLKGSYYTRVAAVMRGRRKTVKTAELVGCSWNELRTYISSKFQEGMTWENYGKWHVDHIKPCASFDFSDVTQLRICFHYSNLQPLWAKDNLKKGGKINFYD